jgi:hypothetical protein
LLRRVSSNRRLCAAALCAGGAMLLGGAGPAVAQDAPADGLPHESIGPFYDIDWSVGLRGSYASNTQTGGEPDAIIAPNVTFTRNGARDQTTLTGGGEFDIDPQGQVRTNNAAVGARLDYQLDELTTLSGQSNLSLTQLKPTDDSLPSGTMTAPLDFTGDVEASATHKFGHLDVTGTLRGERFIEGPTTLADHSVVDNTDQSYWQGEGELRVGYELSPLVTVFVDGTESYQKFDAASPSLGKFLDGKTTELRGGFSYALNSTMTAEASAGRAWYDYDDPSITDVPGWVYDAKVTFTPDETLSLSGDFNTSIGPSSDTAGDTDIAYALTGSAKYQVNSWLALRGTAGWNRTDTVAAKETASGYSAGVGLDWQTARHVVWTADYLFEHDAPATAAANDTHTVTVGVTIKR